MSVKIQVGGVKKVVADVIQPGVIVKTGAIYYVYTGSEWLLCDGSILAVSTYPDLAAVLGSTYGGDGISTFGLPTQAQAVRTTPYVTSDKTFETFTSDADIIVNNSSAAFIDIHNGASGAGIRISIIEQNSQGVTIYTDAARTQGCLLPKGTIVLEWDGTAWSLISKTTATISVTLSGSDAWKAPFNAEYRFRLLGGGGGAGGLRDISVSSGAGGGGAYIQAKYYLTAGTQLSYSVGGAGGGGDFSNDGAAGGATTISGGGLSLSAGGGGGGGKRSTGYGGDGHGGASGVPGSNIIPEIYGYGAGGGAGASTGSSSPPGGNPAGIGNYLFGTGGPGRSGGSQQSGANGTGNGAGGSGAFNPLGNCLLSGGSGTVGFLIVEF